MSYEIPTTGEKIEICFGLGGVAFLFYSIAMHGPRDIGTYFYGTISVLILLFASFIAYPERVWPKSLMFKEGETE